MAVSMIRVVSYFISIRRFLLKVIVFNLLEEVVIVFEGALVF